jgi:hypothetical protein
VIPEDSRFESDPDEILPEDPGLPKGWEAGTPDPGNPDDVARLTALLRAPKSEDAAVTIGSLRSIVCSSYSPL